MNMVEPKLVKLERACLRSAIVSFVDGQNHRPVGFAQDAGDFAIAGNESFASIYNKDKKIGRCDCATPPFEHERVKWVVALAEQAAGVDDLKVTTTPFGRMRDDIPRGTGHSRHDCAAATGEAIEERRFTDVRTPDQHDREVSPTVHLTA